MVQFYSDLEGNKGWEDEELIQILQHPVFLFMPFHPT